MTIRRILAALALNAGLAATLGACATTAGRTTAGTAMPQRAGNAAMMEALGMTMMKGGALRAAIAAADAHPLGSARNPVRADAPEGQRAYLARLRCADGSRPDFTRTGNLGPGVFDTIVDAYRVTCAGQAPVEVVMDMYHRHVETRPVPGFTIVAP